MRPTHSRLALGLAAALAMPAALAQQAPSPDPQHAPVDLERVVVKATPLPTTAEDITRPVEVLTGPRLEQAKSSSLGDTVDGLPGVQSSHFGPGVGRPIVRGLDGARVQVLADGMGSGDVSTVSVDHAVSIEPFLADQIEVLKGPSTLLFGSGAIGGAVNVLDGRVPERMPDAVDGLSGRAELRTGGPTRLRSGMLRVDGAIGGTHGWAFHFDALGRDAGDLRIPGHAESAALLATEGETPDEDLRGILPNSAINTTAAALGVSRIGEPGFFGGSYSLFSTRYGIPGHAHAEDEHGHGDHEGEAGAGAHGGVQIGLEQRRSELRGGIDETGLGALRLKYARTGYTHTEFEGDAIGTVFDNRTDELRAELVHKPFAGWQGALGLQYVERDFQAFGEEAFVPPTLGRDLGLFWMGRRGFGAIALEVGARHDRVRLQSTPQAALQARRNQRDFGISSLSAAARWDVNERFHVALGLDRAQRAPTSEELYSNGYHAATGNFELGDDGLRPETANRAELGLHWHSARLTLGASVFRTDYRDFIYQGAVADAGDPGEPLTEGGAPVYLWAQDDARFHGGEVEATWALTTDPENAWDLHLFADAVHASLRGDGVEAVGLELFHDGHLHDEDGLIARGGNLPRLAPGRIGADLRWQGAAWRGSVGAVRTLHQGRVAAYETATPGYTLVNAHLAWHHDLADGSELELFLDGRNLLDAEARPHTSFLKDLAPLQGRDLQLGVRWYF